MAHRYRLYPEASQIGVLEKHCAHARFVWNLALEQWNGWRREFGPVPGPTERGRQLAEARKDTWLGNGSSSVQQQALRDFDGAVKNFFGGSHRRPTWRKKGGHEGFCVRDVNVHLFNRRWASVFVPKCGPVRFGLSRPSPSDYGTARVTLDRAGRWHVSFTAPQPTIERTPTRKVVGIDLGVVATITTSKGTSLCGPSLSLGEAQRLRRLQRRIARQKKGSNRRQQSKVAIARLKAHEADRRKDFIEKTSTDLVRHFDLLVIEDLAVKNMVRSARGTIEDPGVNVAQKRGLNRSIHSQGWSMLRRRIEDKAATCNVQVLTINPSHTSQRCAACGHVAAKNRKNQAVFQCQSCGHRDNADVNAAKNILAAGLVVTARGGTSHQGPDEARTTQRVAA
jgi:IS605 OrfB family transposase